MDNIKNCTKIVHKWNCYSLKSISLNRTINYNAWKLINNVICAAYTRVFDQTNNWFARNAYYHWNIEQRER